MIIGDIIMPTMDYEGKAEIELEKIKNHTEITEKNKELLIKYHRDLVLDGYSGARKHKLLNTLKIIAIEIEYNFKEATKKDYMIIIKSFYKWINNGEYPEKVKWIKTTLKNRNKKLPQFNKF
ncbi:XerD/XerC family integrase [Methanonatronarchaeum thermophilum]|uniref:XerD/XerC family integrase n=1 Tax=Methanonatronarchaeum thermophilum TaxID=1927129 RepID=A0A1Y3GAI9_9EURY|nr:hypothetical protein [Methanonatronarchaeum thermophilum]OUJ18260.1 XerD/XerC family integrase [Methanonatronarchaeum thermophilum]